MIPLPYRTSVFQSRFDIPRPAERIERFRGKAAFSHFWGTTDANGFKLYDYGGLSKRSFIYYFVGEFHRREDGADITVRLKPRALETILLLAIWAIGVALILNPDLRGIGIAVAISNLRGRRKDR